jgi:hypothetical protein
MVTDFLVFAIASAIFSAVIASSIFSAGIAGAISSAGVAGAIFAAAVGFGYVYSAIARRRRRKHVVKIANEVIDLLAQSDHSGYIEHSELYVFVGQYSASESWTLLVLDVHAELRARRALEYANKPCDEVIYRLTMNGYFDYSLRKRKGNA